MVRIFWLTGLSILAVLGGIQFRKSQYARHLILFILLPSALIYIPAFYYANGPQPIANRPGTLKCKICGKPATRALGGETQVSTWFYGSPGQTQPLPIDLVQQRYPYLYCDSHEPTLFDRLHYLDQPGSGGKFIVWAFGFVVCCAVVMIIFSLSFRKLGLRSPLLKWCIR